MTDTLTSQDIDLSSWDTLYTANDNETLFCGGNIQIKYLYHVFFSYVLLVTYWIMLETMPTYHQTWTPHIIIIIIIIIIILHGVHFFWL